MGRYADMVDVLAGVRPEVQRRVSSAVMAVLSLAEAYRSFGADFTFGVSSELERDVLAVMRGLSEGCLDICERKARGILATLDIEDGEAVLADAEERNNPNGVLWAFDMHSSNLLKVIGAWLTIGFSRGMDRSAIYTSILTAVNTDPSSGTWRSAIRSGLIDPAEVRFGRGYQRRITDAFTVLIQSIVFTAYTEGVMREADEAGALYYVVHRGSSFDCSYCDSRCERPTPMSEPYYPSHPRCMCWLEFLFSEEEAENYGRF